MPVTYNGIGTHYYGKKNVQTRRGSCHSCGREVELSSYDTRLWFVILFIPLIPLGRKRILDACPSCRRHYASDLDKWETARQLEISGAMDNFRSHPTPEAAVAVHQQMVGFHQIAEADEFEKTMARQFPESARLQAYLGAAHEHLGRGTQALEFYKRALALRPDLPEARLGVARGHLRNGQLDEARKLLDFLEKPGAAQLYSLEPLEHLARGYQAAGRHQEALELFGKLLEALPKLAEHAGFRKLVKQSEKALNRPGSLLPKQKFSLKRILQGGGGQTVPPRALLAVGVLVALGLLAAVISNEYIRRHRKLYLVNGYSQVATVEISGAGAVRNFRGVRSLALPEGRHHAVLRGPVQQEFDFELRDTYFNRWFGDPAWVLNVGGGALLQMISATYSQNPQPANISFYTGRNFFSFANVTHPFTPLPSSVKIEAGGSRTLVHIGLYQGAGADVFGHYETTRGAAEALDFAESWLRAHPDDVAVLQLYATTARRRKQDERLEMFLRAGVASRPVRIEWNRVYQHLHDRPAEHASLVQQYEQMLQADPGNSALLYLRGRLESDRASARSYFQRSTNADPRNPFPFFALAYDRMAAAKWGDARPFLARALELKPGDEHFAGLLFTTRLALGESAALEKDERQKLGGDPLDYYAEFRLLEALAAQGKTNEMDTAKNEFIAACRSHYGTRAQALVNAVQYRAWYAGGDLEKLKTAAANDRTQAGRMALATAELELGNFEAAAKCLPPDLEDEDEQTFLFGLAVAAREKGNMAASAQWQAKGVESLRQGNEDCLAAAALFTRNTPPSRDEAEGLALATREKAVILALLSQRHPAAHDSLAGLARALNVERRFPYYLVRRVTAEAPERPTTQ